MKDLCAQLAGVVVLLILLAGCSREFSPLTWEQLAGATYHTGNTDSKTVTLVDAEFVDEPSRVRIVLPRRFVTRGDLDGDTFVDAAVVLVSNTGGTGVFHDLCVVLNREGVPVHVATEFLGDRIRINSLEVDSGEIVLDMIVQGPDEPMCCPTRRQVRRFRLEEGALVELTGAGRDDSADHL